MRKLPSSLGFLLTLLLTVSASAQNFWQQTNGPYGGTALSLAIAPSGSLFAGTEGGGVYRSTDNGESWIHVGLANSAVLALAVNSSGTVFAGTRDGGLFRSTDGGGSWTQTGLASTSVWSLALNANGNIFAGANADVFFAASVFRSTDNGGTWTQPSWTVEDEIRTLAVNSSGHVFAGACADLFCFSGGLYRSVDNGGSWTPVTGGLTSTPVVSLAINSNGDLYAGTGGGVFRSTNNGGSWTQTGLTSTYVGALVVNATGDIFAGSAVGIYRSTDAGANWTKVNVGLTSTSVRALAVNSTGSLFAGTSGGGVFRSIDNGGSWTPVNNGVASTRVQTLSIHSSGWIVAGTDIGIFHSTDIGGTWIPGNVGLSYLNIRSVATHPNGRIFAGTDVGVSRSSDTARSWTPSGLSFTAVNALDVLSSGYILAGTGSGVYRSTDNGGNWTQVGLAGTGVNALTIQPNGNVFAGINSGVFRSTDNGVSWTQTGLTGTVVRSLAFSLSGYTLAGTDNGVYRSGDNGASWTQVGLTTSPVTAFATNSSGHIFAGTASDGVFRSTDNGTNWNAVSTGLTISSVLCLAANPTGFLFAGSSAGGVFKTVQSTLPVTTEAATGIGTTSATLNGTVNPTGLATTAYFEWGTSNTLSASSATPSQSIGSGISPVPVSAELTGLASNTTYYFRVTSQNFAGTRRGSILSFSTSANLPTTTTASATAVTTSSATLNGTVNPNGASTTAFFEWGTSSTLSTFSVTSSQFAGSGTNAVSVTANLTGLSANTTYYDRVVGQNSAGTQRGSIASFTTGGLAPTVTTSAATSVMSTSATLNGNVNPNGTSTSAYFEWGTSSTLSTYSTTSAQSVGSGTSAASVSADLSGLSANTTYYYRVVGQNSAGTQRGTIVSFSTLAAGIAPTVTTGSPSNISTTSATLTGTVNPNGSSTSVVFQYGTSTSYGNQATATQSPVTGSSAVSVSALLTGLSSGTTYHYRVVATNSAGTSNGSDQTFISYSTSFAVSTSVSFPSRVKASDYSATDYRLVGLPGASDLAVNTILTGAQNVDWQAYWDNGAASNYLVEFDGSSTFRFTVGRAFWIISKGALNISRTVTAPSLNASLEAEIPLQSGWNMITNPFTLTISWSKIQSTNGTNAPIYTFNGSFSTSSNFDPYVGYYFFNGSPNTTLTKLRIPYASIFSKTSEPIEVTPGGWRINVAFSAGGIIDAEAWIGVSNLAKDGLDLLDTRKPRGLPDLATVYFERPEWDNDFSAFASDIRSEIDEFKTWDFSTVGEVGKSASLAFRRVSSVPQQYAVYLIDVERARTTDLRRDSVYSFVPKMKVSNFRVLVGTPAAVERQVADVVPREFSLSQNFPNPFNPSTTVSVSLPAPSEVRISVFNTLGQETRSLFAGWLEAGRRWFTWDGRNEQGVAMPSGAYYCVLRVPSRQSFVTKMILMR